MVSTVKYKQQGEIDLHKALESGMTMLAASGGKNILPPQEQDFETKEGITGLKGYGTFSRIDPLKKTSVKIYYEVLYFSQEGGLQQITILHEEGDKYANELSDRVLRSVELKKVSE